MTSQTSPDTPSMSELWPYLTEDEKAFLRQLAQSQEKVWLPLEGPQRMAFESTADVIGYGGAAGGGKTDLMCGLALTEHTKTLILRREATQLVGIIDRTREIVGHKDGFNGMEKIWRFKDGSNRQIEYGSVPHVDDWNKYQGRPHDLLAFDEAANFLESQIRALLGWVRTVNPEQRCRALLTFNPPTTSEGRWIIPFFGPWLDDKHPNPAEPGEIRNFAMVKGKEIEVEELTPFVITDEGERVYDYDPQDFKPTQIIEPKSRTFIASRITDNPHLMGTGYMSQLQALPEPLRSQMLDGDFKAGMSDDPWQLIPTAWVDAAQERWEDLYPKPEMDSMGVDVARGGKDSTVIYRRHGKWFDIPIIEPGKETPNGQAVTGLVISAHRDQAPIHIDVIGVGSSPYDFLTEANQPVYGINVGSGSVGTDKSGCLTFKNLRSEIMWKLREDFDPLSNTGIAIPPDPQLAADLCCPMWKVQGAEIYVEGREDIIKRLGKSPDHFAAIALANINTPKVSTLDSGTLESEITSYNPYE